MIEHDTGLLQFLGLHDRAGDTVKDVPLRTIVLFESFADDTNDDLIGHEFSAVHAGFDLQAKLGAVFHGSTKHIAGGNGRNSKLAGKDGRLCAFPCAGSTQ